MPDGFFSVTVPYVTKLKIEKLARHKDRSETWIVKRAFEIIKEDDL